MGVLASNPVRVGVINGLRGVAILWVIYHHLFSRLTPPGWHGVTLAGVHVPVFAPLANGWLGVNLFFLLSGFVLFLPYASGKRQLASRADVLDFYRRRVRRLLPLYYFSLVVTWAFFSRPETLREFALMLTVTFPFTTSEWTPRCNWVLWSLGVEFWLSALFPLVVVGLRRWGVARLLVAVGALSLLVRVLGVWSPAFESGNLYLNALKDSPLGRLDEFALGLVLAQLYVEGKRLGSRPALLAAAGALCVWLGCVLWDEVALGHLPRALRPALNLVVDGGFFLLTAAALDAVGPLRQLFANTTLQVLGMMCYSLYVWHGIVMVKVVGGELDVLHVGLFLLLLACLSAFTYRFIEFHHERDARRLFSGSS
jgi:peptidoglycan/LPS O-acetylase OafA/YrhL